MFFLFLMLQVLVPAGFFSSKCTCESHNQKGAIKLQCPNSNGLQELYQTSKVMCDDTGFA